MMANIDRITTKLDVLWVAWIVYWIVGEPLYEFAKHSSKQITTWNVKRRNIESYILLMIAFGILQISFTGNLSFLGEGFPPNTLVV